MDQAVAQWLNGPTTYPGASDCQLTTFAHCLSRNYEDFGVRRLIVFSNFSIRWDVQVSP